MNPLAKDLNDQIAAVNPHVLEMLSDFGAGLYFPKGILSQSAEAKTKATLYNATIGTALESGTAMNLPSVMAPLAGVPPNEALLYAPAGGVPELRQAWQAKTLTDNPDLAGAPVSLPIVTSGLTHGLSLLGDLFIDEGDVLLLPDKLWGNYRLIFGLRRGADIRTFPFFAEGGFNQEAFAAALQELAASGVKKVVVLLNFPNNPTGYAPTEAEGEAMAASLLAAADQGINVVAITDDAYFGLFYGEEPMRQSLFTKLAGKHPRLLAVKADAATKEVFVWGLRVGFLAYSVGGADSDSPLYQALISKTMGCIRSMISNCCRLSQTLVLGSVTSETFFAERAAKIALMESRALEAKRVLANAAFDEAWDAYPFNSGYFMCLRLKKIDAESLRVHLLDAYGIGTIAIGDTDLRVAFSCLEVEQIQDVYEKIHQAWCDLAKA
ncbi:MAG: aminotransferase class I/II-fold pyridoxal phosphate-dependent enzyme [Victivallales bacterium]|jgi:aspartate/methionine/tyrosine aminotransferase|nr:aminotransferase class I/II-fold pyridoxal phosphate-dependent enzyme [Victivallales bacterium]